MLERGECEDLGSGVPGGSVRGPLSDSTLASSSAMSKAASPEEVKHVGDRETGHVLGMEKEKLEGPGLEKNFQAGEERNLLAQSKLPGFMRAAVKKAAHSGGISWQEELIF